jgi:hypothetical protein
MKIAESFPSPGDEKITKGLAHCEERPAPYVMTNKKCAIFSNSVAETRITERDIYPMIKKKTFEKRSIKICQFL